MALSQNTRTAGAGLSGIFNRIARWNDDRFAIKALSRLSARELDDIGLTPGDVDRMSRRHWF